MMLKWVIVLGVIENVTYPNAQIEIEIQIICIASYSTKYTVIETDITLEGKAIKTLVRK